MNNPLVLEIAKLYDLIEASENEHDKLINSGADSILLRHSQNGIEMLKQRMQELEDLLLDDSLNSQL